MFVAPAKFYQFGAEHARLVSAVIHDLHIGLAASSMSVKGKKDVRASS
jgi:hypothetical protein